jgi:alpha-tubulin suppressor-like RCC1 family protein
MVFGRSGRERFGFVGTFGAAAILLSACGLTNPFPKAPAAAPAPTVFDPPIVAKLESATPTNDRAAKITLVYCGPITSVLVNEGPAPKTTDAGWAPCKTTAGAISYTVGAGGGAHFLHVWGRDASGHVSEHSGQVTVVIGDSMFALGDSHSCALIAGAVKCWGDNTWGQLGTGSSDANTKAPVTVSGLESGVDSIASGIHGKSTCAVLSGRVWCWGSNATHELGNDSSTAECTGGTTTIKCSRTPLVVTDSEGTALEGVVSIHAGTDYYCASLTDGSLRCWGNDALGQLGDGLAVGMSSPSPVAPGLSQDALWTATGYSTACSLLSDGSSLACWGLDYALYDGYGESSALVGGTPDVTAGPLKFASSPRNIVALGDAGVPDSLVLGYYQACGLFGGNVKCWGVNTRGQIGSGLRSNAATVSDVILPAQANLIVSGAHHDCVRLTTGVIECWGMNDLGELGAISDETCIDRTCSRVPLAVSGLPSVAAMGAGRSQTCAATDEGISCWGSDDTFLLQGSAKESCVVMTGADPVACSHTPVLMSGL